MKINVLANSCNMTVVIQHKPKMAAELCTDAPVHDESFFYFFILFPETLRDARNTADHANANHVNPHQLLSYLFIWRGATLDFCETQDTINQSLIDPNFSGYKKLR